MKKSSDKIYVVHEVVLHEGRNLLYVGIDEEKAAQLVLEECKFDGKVWRMIETWQDGVCIA